MLFLICSYRHSPWGLSSTAILPWLRLLYVDVYSSHVRLLVSTGTKVHQKIDKVNTL